GGEVMLHERVFGSFRADLVCKLGGFFRLPRSGERERQDKLVIPVYLSSNYLAFVASSLHDPSDFGILKGRLRNRREYIWRLRWKPKSLQAQPFGGAKAALLSLDEVMADQDVSSIS